MFYNVKKFLTAVFDDIEVKDNCILSISNVNDDIDESILSYISYENNEKVIYQLSGDYDMLNDCQKYISFFLTKVIGDIQFTLDKMDGIWLLTRELENKEDDIEVILEFSNTYDDAVYVRLFDKNKKMNSAILMLNRYQNIITGYRFPENVSTVAETHDETNLYEFVHNYLDLFGRLYTIEDLAKDESRLESFKLALVSFAKEYGVI